MPGSVAPARHSRRPHETLGLGDVIGGQAVAISIIISILYNMIIRLAPYRLQRHGRITTVLLAKAKPLI